MIVLWVIVAVVIVALLYVAYGFNRLVRLRTQTQAAWSDIDVELRRRHDLIPNVVSTVQGYATHEREVFEEVAHARSSAVSAAQSGDPAVMAGAENALTGAVSRLMAVAENYPQLQAAQLFLNLQEQLTTTEDKVEFSRRYYNANVRDFNSRLQRFPTNLIGRSMGFQPFSFFAADAQDRVAPQVTFAPPAGTAPAS